MGVYPLCQSLFRAPNDFQWFYYAFNTLQWANKHPEGQGNCVSVGNRSDGDKSAGLSPTT